MNSKLKVGVTCWKPAVGWDAETLCSQAECVEAMGFHSFWLPENHFGDGRAMPAPLTSLAAVAARTRRVKLGTVSYLLPIRNPLLAAEEVAVLDQLSGGRVILGVGRGIQPEVFQAFDVPIKEKRQRFAQHLEFMRSAWSGEPVLEDTSGRPVCLSPLPVQQPGPPIWVAAFGPLALEQVGSLGLPYLASPMESLDVLETNYRRFHDCVEAAGHDSVTTIPLMRTVFISDDPAMVRQVQKSLASLMAGSRRGNSDPVDHWTIVGDEYYVRDRIDEYRERLGVTHLLLGGRLPGITAPEFVASLGRFQECQAS